MNNPIKILVFLMLGAVLVFAGCTSAPETDNSQTGIAPQDTSSAEDIARRESEEGDETQENINDALTTLSALGDYMSPGGRNTIEVEIEVDENGIIQSARVLEENVPSSTSRTWIQRYNEGIEAEVVGVPLSEAVSPAVVNRSSLTAQGFNQALDRIREEMQ